MKRALRSALSRRRRNQGGYAAMLVAMFAGTVMVPLCALSVDVSRWYVEVQRVQNAADAAATAGVTFLPDDFASAKAAAIAVAGRNGYPDAGSSQVDVSVGDKPTQLQVTITSTIGNAFGAAFNQGLAHIARSATADYNGPAPMGSPCNTFGNEPTGSSSDSERGPAGSVISAPAGGAVCSSNPQFWGAIAGPDTPKGNGDEYMTRTCASGNDGCTGTTNTEFDPRGYFYVVRVAPAAVGTPITLQTYDPSWVENGDTCNSAPDDGSGQLQDNMNDYTTVDGTTRYAKAANTFCSGDVNNGGSDLITTSFDVRNPTDTYNPSNGTPIAGCAKQYPGYTKDQVTTAALRKGNAAYNPDLAGVFHQWVPLCTFTPSQSGDYYLQVRTNVALGGSPDGQGGYQGNPAVYNQTGDDTSVHGSGNNRFALRVKGAPGASVSVAGWQHMSIYANYAGANSTFNLVRVIPAAATKTLVIGFYDVGDATNPGTIRVLPPTDSNMSSAISGCMGSGVVNGALTDCQLNNVSHDSGWDGKSQYVRIPIPGSYTCTATQPGGCWFRLQVSFPGGVTDTTTWTAQITGDPVRLIK